MDEFVLNPTWLAMLLTDRSPCLRRRVLVDLLALPEDDPEVIELDDFRAEDRIIQELVASQSEDGSWDGASLDATLGRLRTTCHALMRMAYLGFDTQFLPVRRGLDYVMAYQQEDGSWPLPHAHVDADGTVEGTEGYDMMPLQSVFPLLAMAMCGMACDPRAKRAYEWLLAQRLDDGAWPTGTAAGNLGYVAGYRRLAHSRWGCRSNTTGALLCLAYHPERRSGSAARRALDLLLGRETREAGNLGFEVARIVGAVPIRGFITHFARFDPGLVLDLCWRVGADTSDERVADLVRFVRDQQGPIGLWEYAARPQASRWVSFDLLRSLMRTRADAGWQGQEPRTPFQPYPTRRQRY